MTIKEARKSVGLTQTELGRLVGANLTTVCNWERGLTCPSGIHLQRIAKATKVSADDIELKGAEK